MMVSKDVRTTFTPDGAVLMDIRGGHMITLNPVGSIIWQQLSDGRSAEEIAEHLSSRFSVPREQTLADVNEFFEKLQAQHLIDPSEPPHTSFSFRPSGLFCNLFGSRSSRTAGERSSK